MIVLTLAGLCGVWQDTLCHKEAVNALVAIDAFCVLLTFLAYSAPLVVAEVVKGETLIVDLLIVLALVRVAVTVAALTLKSILTSVLKIRMNNGG
jgi:hypothetical protein